jgi:urease accessory protein
MNAPLRTSDRKRPFSLHGTAPLVAITALAVVVSGQPASAHGIASGGLGAGLLHPLLGSDHLLLLLGVGAASASLSAQLLLWGLAGAACGGIYGALGGGLPAAEVLAALAITAVAALVLRNQTSTTSGAINNATPALGLAGSVIATSVAIHAMLHGQEATAALATPTWWLGALASSALVAGGSYGLLRHQPAIWSQRLALGLALAGGLLAIAPVIG